MSKTPLAEINPFAPETLACPYDFNRQLREEAPVYHCPQTDVYFVSTFDLVVSVVKNNSAFSNKFSLAATGSEEKKSDPELDAIRRQGYPPVNTMLTQDLPKQRRYRSLCQKPFSVKNVSKLQSFISDLANEIIDEFIDDGACNWMDAFAVPLPVRMIGYVLGVPLGDMNRFKKWSDSSVYQFSAGQTRQGTLDAAQDVVDFQHYFAEKIRERQHQPTNDVLSDIVNSIADGEKPMDVPECLSVISQLLVAGNETTTATLAEGLYLLIQNPDQLALVQKDMSLIPNMVEEMLRLSSPSAQMWRICTQDTQVADTLIPKGARVMVKWISANRDEMQFVTGDKFDVTRPNAKKQIAFGQGIHHCPGAPLARQELVISFEAILSRMTNFRLPEGQTELAFLPNLLLHGPADLNIEFDKK
ncbi:MAG: cytochrome P450 [Flavobacterium sp.]|jgi:cytochrome P450